MAHIFNYLIEKDRGISLGLIKLIEMIRCRVLFYLVLFPLRSIK